MPRSTAVRLRSVPFSLPPTPPEPPPRATLSRAHAATQTPRFLSLRRRRMPLDGVARSAENACRAVDDSARLSFVSQIHDRTMLRLRSSKPLEELKASLSARFPLARVRAFEDCLDGSVGAELELPGAHEAFLLAQERVRAWRSLRALRALSHFVLIITIAVYLKELAA